MAIDAALGRLGIRPGVCTSSTRPANPFEGQVIYETDTNNIRFWSGSAWESNKGGIISSSAPTGAAAGDIWYDSDDGRAYIYYDDGSSQQWVEFGAAPSGSSITLASYADSAARTSAIPSPTEADLSYLQDTNSVEVYDGSAWAAVGGGGRLELITSTTVSGVTSASIDNCFTSDYQNYVVRWSATALASSLHDIRVQFRSGGTTDSGSIYKNRTLVCLSNSTVGATFLDTNFLYFSVASPTYLTFATATVYGPNLASDTGWTSRITGFETGGAHVSGSLANSTTQYDGIYFYHAVGGTFSGTFDVFGVID